MTESEEQFHDRKRRTDAVVDLITGRLGPEIASEWAWSCTPIPCGLPSDDQLDDGRRLADGLVTVDELIAKAETEMAARSDGVPA